MKRLVLDFLRRWWWMVALVILFAGLAAFGRPVLFTPAALVCLLLDTKRGLFRVVCPLPLTCRTQALTWWFIGVFLLPLLVLVPLTLGTQIYVGTHETSPALAPWFYAAINFWGAFGYAGLCFLLVMRLPTRPTVGALEWIEQSIVGGLWGFSMAGLPLILSQLPKTPAAILPWHTAFFVAVPVCVVLSYFAAPGMLRRRMFFVAGRKEARPSPPLAARPVSGLAGIPLYLLTFVGRMLAMLVLMVIIQWLCFGLIRGARDAATPAGHLVSIQVVMLSILFGAISVESISLRTLRCLPLSTGQLTLLLLAMPWATGLLAALFTAVWGGIGDPRLATGLNFAAQVLALAGCSSLALAVLLHVASGGRIFLLMLLAMASAFSLKFLGNYPSFLALGGSVMLGLACWLIHRGLRTSNAFYQPRHVFGISPGQPLGGH